MTTAILFLIFNRPDTTSQVFSVIKKAQPKKLYIASDGPRNERLNEKEIVLSLRNNILNQIDWDCEVKTLFREKNLGCKIAVSSALDWFFEHEEQGIILEDDCLPDLSFFQFCDELLEKYKNNEKIAMISGNHFNDKKIGDDDYYFKRIPHIWGWATWRRSWKKFDIKMKDYLVFKNKNKIKDIWNNKKFQEYWIDIFNQVYKNKINTWDYQLTYSVFKNDNLCICPNINLVKNVGFGKNSTNTLLINKNIDKLNINSIDFPLKHPENINYSVSSDDYINRLNLNNFRIKKILKFLGIINIIKNYYKRF